MLVNKESLTQIWNVILRDKQKTLCMFTIRPYSIFWAFALFTEHSLRITGKYKKMHAIAGYDFIARSVFPEIVSGLQEGSRNYLLL